MMKHTTTLLTTIFLFFLVIEISYSADEYYEFNYSNHTYRLYFKNLNWTEAAEYAANAGGYLIEINSAGEQQAVYTALTDQQSGLNVNYTSVNDGGGVAYLWIGANDRATEGTWFWDGDNDSEGQQFWSGEGYAGGSDGEAIDGSYYNWGGTASGFPNEPDDYNNNQDAAAMGLAPWPKGIGSYGDAGEWNDIKIDNDIMFIVEFDYNALPEKCTKPQGRLNVCPGAQEIYTTDTQEHATEYIWLIEPAEAGTVIGNSNEVTIEWSADYKNDAAFLSVSALNPLGSGETSEQITILVSDIPATPQSISGDTRICMGTTSDFTVEATENAHAFYGVLNPEEAGTILLDGQTVSISWAANFSGEVLLSVSGVNACGEGAPKTIDLNIISSPERPEAPVCQDTQIVQGTKGVVFTVPVQENADSYTWAVLPQGAGVVSSTEMSKSTATAFIDFSSEYVGFAEVAVIAENICGSSEKSNPLEIPVVNDIGITSNDDENNFKIFPNPVKNTITMHSPVSCHDCRIFITNEQGNIVYDASDIKIYKGMERSFSIDHLAHGVYIMTIVTKKGNFTGRFVVLR